MWGVWVLFHASKSQNQAWLWLWVPAASMHLSEAGKNVLFNASPCRYSLKRQRRCHKVQHLFFTRSSPSLTLSQVISTNLKLILTTFLQYKLLLDEAARWWTNIMGLPTIQSCIESLYVSGSVLSVKFTNWSGWAVLHPHFKSMYFVKAKWPHDWITTAEGILRDEWTKTYKTSVEPGPAETMVCCCLSHTVYNLLNKPQAQSSSNNYFAELDAFTVPQIPVQATCLMNGFHFLHWEQYLIWSLGGRQWRQQAIHWLRWPWTFCRCPGMS